MRSAGCAASFSVSAAGSVSWWVWSASTRPDQAHLDTATRHRGDQIQAPAVLGLASSRMAHCTADSIRGGVADFREIGSPMTKELEEDIEYEKAIEIDFSAAENDYAHPEIKLIGETFWSSIFRIAAIHQLPIVQLEYMEGRKPQAQLRRGRAAGRI
jgi:hypothetical protein